MLIQNNDNHRLTLNDKISLLTLPCQSIAKIIMLNILPKSANYGKARGCITLLIYCIMKGLSINLPKLVLDNMTIDNFDNTNLPYSMLLTILFDCWGVDLS